MTGAQSRARSARFGDLGGFDSKIHEDGSFGNSNSLSLSSNFTGNGVNWSSNIWATSSSTTAMPITHKKNDLGSVGCETIKPKSSRDQPNFVLPSDPWNRKPSAWTPPELTPLSSTFKPAPAAMASDVRENKPKSAFPLPRPQPELTTKSSVVARPDHWKAPFTQSFAPNGAMSPGYSHHLPSKTKESCISRHSLDTYVPKQPTDNIHFDDWEEVAAFGTYGSDLESHESHYINRQAAQKSTNGNVLPFRNDVAVSEQFLPTSWPPHSSKKQTADDHWHMIHNIGSNSLQSKISEVHTTSNDHNSHRLMQKFKQNGANDYGQISSGAARLSEEPRGYLMHQMNQTAFSADHALVSLRNTPPAEASNWKNVSNTLQSQQAQLPNGHLDTWRSFQPQQQRGYDFVGTESRRRMDESERTLKPAMDSSLFPYRYYINATPPNIIPTLMRSRELTISSQDHDPQIHQHLQNAMLYQMRGYYPYHLGFGYTEASMPYMHIPQLILQPRPPPLGLVPQVDAENGLRSALLDEFRNNVKGNRRFELRDIYDHVVEFSGDQQGARFIQTKLETANSAEKDRIFRELSRDAVPLMRDIYGNYVIQKFFEHGDQSQKKVLLGKMKGQVVDLSLQIYACRVVQKALDTVLFDEKLCLVKELERHVLRCIKDLHGNHVIQKTIEVLPVEYVQFILDALVGQIRQLSIHISGCRVVQRLLKKCHAQEKTKILQEVHSCASALIENQYGNYVVQEILKDGESEDITKLNAVIKSHLILFSKQKFASCVVEAALLLGTNQFRREIMHLVTAKNGHGESEILGMLKDQYANYVIQTLYHTLSAEDGRFFNDLLKPYVNLAGQAPASCRQAQNMAMKMRKFDNPFYISRQMQTGPRLALTDSSARSTPPLFMDDAQSTFSSSLPSLVGDSTPPYSDIDHRAHTVMSDYDIKIEITQS